MFRRLTLSAAVLAAALAPLAANAAITPDPGYGTGGTATVPLQCAGGSYANSEPGYGGRTFVLQKCSGGYYRLIAVGNDGELVTSWGTDGHLTFKVSSTCDGASALRTAKNGQVYVGFSTSGSHGSDPALRDMHACFTKITSTGKLVTNYGSFGSHAGAFRHLDRLSPTGASSHFTRMAIDAHGRLLVFSQQYSRDNWQQSAAFINRFTTEGKPDVTFNRDGQASYTYPSQTDLLWGDAIYDDPVVAINVSSGPGGGTVGTAFVRFDTLGHPSALFAGDGVRFIDQYKDLGGAEIGYGSSIALDSHNRIVFAAQKGSSWIKVWRMSGIGRMDLAFNKATQKIQPTAGLIPYADLFVTAGHYLVSWATSEMDSNAGFTTGFNDDGTRWTAVSPTGTANVTAAFARPDAAAFYQVHAPSGQPITITRSLIQ